MEWLIYIAKVTQKPQLALTIGRRNLKAARLHLRGARWLARRKKRAIYHAYTDERVKDVGKKFRKAYVFLSTLAITEKRLQVEVSVNQRFGGRMTQGYRVNHSSLLLASCSI